MSTLDEFKQLAPKLWKDVEKKFTKKTKVPLELIDSEYSQTTNKDIEYERVLYTFKCEGVECKIGTQLPDYIVTAVSKDKKIFNTVSKSIVDSMIIKYNAWVQASTVNQILNKLPKKEEGNK